MCFLFLTVQVSGFVQMKVKTRGKSADSCQESSNAKHHKNSGFWFHQEHVCQSVTHLNLLEIIRN